MNPKMKNEKIEMRKVKPTRETSVARKLQKQNKMKKKKNWKPEFVKKNKKKSN